MSNYVGYVVKVKELRPHTNADRLVIATFFGNDTCVSNNIQIGDIGIYFPSDLQLNEEFCDYNHLCRKTATGEPDTGYLERDKRRITAIKLRGERSDGIYMPLKSLEYTGVDLSTLKVGDPIGTINGHEICCKYIPVRKNRRDSGTGNHTRKKRLNIAPLFAEHADTEQLAYNLNAFQVGDEVEITLKMHGCFKIDTPVRLADGSLKSIQKIVPGDEVLGYNFATNKIVPTKVVHTFKNAPSNNWRNLKFSRNGIRGDKRGIITATHNHKFWVKEKNAWIEAKDLQVGEVISTLYPSAVYTNKQKQLLLGTILGDGCLLSYRNQTCEIQISSKHKEYLLYLQDIFGTEAFTVYDSVRVSGYGTNIYKARTLRCADLYNYFTNYFTFSNLKDEDKLKENIVEEITLEALMLLFFEDGSLAHHEKQRDRINIAICDYNDHDAEIIVKCFQKFGLSPVLYKDNRNYNRLRLNTKDAYTFFNLIKEYVPSIMEYKLPRDITTKYKTLDVNKEDFIANGYVLVPQTVLLNDLNTTVYDEYDLETELHNYIVGLNIVHNTSQRTARLPMRQDYKRTFLDRLFKREGKPIYNWGYISGTRRTVLDGYDGGYYGSNQFREQHSKIFEGKLPKGVSVYYEIVGFTTDGTPIMGTGKNKSLGKDFVKQYGETTVFSYGCVPNPQYNEITYPQSDIYVYRMTYTNEDGDVFEIPPDEMRFMCGCWNIKTVPVFDKFIITQDELDRTGLTAGEYVKQRAEEYYDGPDPIGKSHVREGVVVRIINKHKFTAFKHKGFAFKCITGIAIAQLEDSGATDNIDADILSEM